MSTADRVPMDISTHVCVGCGSSFDEQSVVVCVETGEVLQDELAVRDRQLFHRVCFLDAARRDEVVDDE